ncbi:MAG: hypoxanthine phosphoribosyltransferase [Candidatus Krumholzibacteria bacterium]|nr:hypoxanthine phosphoribosyltransferase [Candidatus Krumholzibacteria bacterium]
MVKNDAHEPGDVLLSAEEIADVVGRLGREISSDYHGRDLILVNLLKGGVVFLADLIRQLSIPHQIDFLRVSSYEDGTGSSGIVRIIEDLGTNVAGRDVLIVEDVLDSGRTLSYILDMLRIRSPRSLEVCSLLRKQFVTTSPRPTIRYLGKEIPDVFVVGYGLDYNERFRNLPYIAKLVIVEKL